jgi:hypothetical protein
MLPPGVWSRTQNNRCPTWWRVIAYLAATFAPATKSDKGTREKFETQDHSRGARNCGALAQRPLFWRFGREFRLVAAAQAFI